MVATAIRLRTFFGMISDTHAQLVGKSIHMPMPRRNCPARMNEGVGASAHSPRPRSDNRHVCEENALATDLVRRDTAEHCAHDGP
jgi:hypothetical protein